MTKKTERSKAAALLGRKGGSTTAKRLTPEQRTESARRAALARWEKKHPGQKPEDYVNPKLRELIDRYDLSIERLPISGHATEEMRARHDVPAKKREDKQ